MFLVAMSWFVSCLIFICLVRGADVRYKSNQIVGVICILFLPICLWNLSVVFLVFWLFGAMLFF